jgi:hypothetical protein
MSDQEERRQGTAIERHIQTILAVVVTSILLWVGSTVSASREEIVRLQEQVSALQARLGIVNDMERRINGLELRIGILENKSGLGK